MPPKLQTASSGRRKDPLRIHLEERPSRHVCPRTWLPKVYKFDDKELLYQENAYDRFLRYAQEEESPEDCSAHSQFLDYLQTIPNDTSMFYKWIKDVETKGKPEKLRSATHPSINQDLQKFREAYTSRNIPKSLAENEFPYDEKIFFTAESTAWMMGSEQSRPQLNVKVGWLKVDLVENACYGPRRFYVRLTSAGTDRKFDAAFRSFLAWCNDVGYRMFSQRKIGFGVYFDPEKDLFSSVIVMGEGGACMVVYEMDTGRVIRVANRDVESRLRVLRPQMYKDIQIPTSIPVELVDPVSPDEWDDFIEELRDVKQLYVTAVDGYSLKVSRYQPLGSSHPMAETFCRNLYCTGRCSVPREWRNPPQQETLSNAMESGSVRQSGLGFGDDLAAAQIVSVC